MYKYNLDIIEKVQAKPFALLGFSPHFRVWAKNDPQTVGSDPSVFILHCSTAPWELSTQGHNRSSADS
eukprot:scaffold8241_cov171-Amphora_coffeaeformis.AAC.3